MTVKTIITLFIVFQSIVFSLSSSTYANEIKIVYPPDNSYVTQSQIRIIGLVSDSSSEVNLSIANSKGKKEYSVSINTNAFNQLVDLAKGKNTISVDASTAAVSSNIFYSTDKTAPGDYTPFVLHSKNELTSDCDKCHLQAKTEGFDYKYVTQKLSCITDKCHSTYGNKKSQHGPFADKSCIECHNPHGTTHKNFLLNIRAPLCFKCHAEAEDMASSGQYVHFPVSKGECLSCHEHHESNLEYHLKRDTMLDLCLGCHTKTIVEHTVMHEPVESGDCNACHSPHISEFKGLLYEGGKELCLTCHEVRKEEFESKYVHEPVAKDCNLCHDPHGSSAFAHLKTKKDKDGKYITVEDPLKESCLSCHLKLDPIVAEQINNSKVIHKPVQEGKCTECHTPHSTNYSKQLNAPLKDICFKCHPKIKKIITESLFKHGPVNTNDCAQCHQVHGSDQKNLLRARYSMKYQGKYDPKNFELCFGCHNQKVIEDDRNKDTGFRNGDKNLHFAHVNREKKGRFCITCHDTHASDQEKHIRKSFTFKKKFKITMEYTKTATGGGCVVGCHKPRTYDRENPVK